MARLPVRALSSLGGIILVGVAVCRMCAALSEAAWLVGFAGVSAFEAVPASLESGGVRYETSQSPLFPGLVEGCVRIPAELDWVSPPRPTVLTVSPRLSDLCVHLAATASDRLCLAQSAFAPWEVAEDFVMWRERFVTSCSGVHFVVVREMKSW